MVSFGKFFERVSYMVWMMVVLLTPGDPVSKIFGLLIALQGGLYIAEGRMLLFEIFYY